MRRRVFDFLPSALDPFRRNARIGSPQFVGLLALLILARPRAFLQPSAASMYAEETGYDKPDDPRSPMWHNLGFWREARTYVDACSDLARCLAGAARLDSRHEVLDVGCGCAEQDVLWIREFEVKRIAAIDVTPGRVALANARIARAGLNDRVEVRVGSATELPFPGERFDRVVALESAFHFLTRERFFGEAFRTLRPGGRLAVADLLPASGPRRSWIKERLLKLARRCYSIPEANMYDRIQYAAKLEQLGFVDVKVESIGDHVFPGFAAQMAGYGGGEEWFSVVVDLQPRDFVAEDWLCPWRDLMGFDEYVIVTADRPPA